MPVLVRGLAGWKYGLRSAIVEEIEALRAEIEHLKARIVALEGEQGEEPDPLLIGTEIFRESQRIKARAKKR